MIPNSNINKNKDPSKDNVIFISKSSSQHTTHSRDTPHTNSNKIISEAIKESEKNMSKMSDQSDLEKEEKNALTDAVKETVKDHTSNSYKLNSLLDKSEKVLLRIKNIIPLIPGEILIDSAKVTFIFRPFFLSERIHSIAINDISDVLVETGPIFGSLKIVDINFTENVVMHKWFFKNDAEKARRVITGLMAAAREEIDLKSINDNKLSQKLENIGKVNGTITSVSAA